MLTIERLRDQVRRMPTSIRLGLVVMAMAIAIDLAAHLVEPSVVGHTGEGHVHTPVQVSAHVGVLVGMVIVFVGVVADGARQWRARRAAARRASKGVA